MHPPTMSHFIHIALVTVKLLVHVFDSEAPTYAEDLWSMRGLLRGELVGPLGHHAFVKYKVISPNCGILKRCISGNNYF